MTKTVSQCFLRNAECDKTFAVLQQLVATPDASLRHKALNKEGDPDNVEHKMTHQPHCLLEL
jgi:hypothetical protein